MFYERSSSELNNYILNKTKKIIQKTTYNKIILIDYYIYILIIFRNILIYIMMITGCSLMNININIYIKFNIIVKIIF